MAQESWPEQRVQLEAWLEHAPKDHTYAMYGLTFRKAEAIRAALAQIDTLAQERDEAHARAKALEQVLRETEWGGGAIEAYCPSCYGYREDGHRATCTLYALLGSLEDEEARPT